MIGPAAGPRAATDRRPPGHPAPTRPDGPTGPTGPTFDLALAGRSGRLVTAAGRTVALHARRWHARPGRADHRLLRRCRAATLDLGCGPGRLTVALAGRGIPVLGVDHSRRAVAATTGRGGPALLADVFDPLPGEGDWWHVLLADGNIGIGGDPVGLLARCRRLLRSGGTVLAEVGPPGAPTWCGPHAVVRGARMGPWFPWATVGADAVATLAVAAGLGAHRAPVRLGGQRWLAELVRP